MKRLTLLVVMLAALAVAASASGGTGPITKQNGTTPAFTQFTSICAVPGYATYGECAGDATKFTTVTGKVNAVQAQPLVYNFGISFAGLVPGASYTLYQNLNGVFSAVGSGVADLSGSIDFGYQATLHDADLIAWDLNHNGSTTIVTSYWSGQPLSPNGEMGSLVVTTLPYAFVRLVKNVVPSDGSLWDFVITNGLDATYAGYTDQATPFNSGAFTLDPTTGNNPGKIEMDEWAGTGTDFNDYTESVTCTDVRLGNSISSQPVAPITTGFYIVGGSMRLWTYFGFVANHSYICTFTNTHGATAPVMDVTSNPSQFTCATGATGGTATTSTVVYTRVGADIRAEIHLVGARPNATFDVWLEQYGSTCPPGTSSPSNPTAITTDGSGNATATITFAPGTSATAVWLSMWTPAGTLTGTQVLRTTSVALTDIP